MRLTVALACALLAALPAAVSGQSAPRASLIVSVTTQGGSVALPGASVTVTTSDGRGIASDITDAEGLLRLASPRAGPYHVVASLDGFDPAEATVTFDGGRDVTVRLDLAISKHAENVEVVASLESEDELPTIASTLSIKSVVASRTVEELPVADHSAFAALRLLSGIIDGPNGLSSAGGRSNQTGLQIGVTTLADSSTGMPLYRLPIDAVESVEFLPNPYAVEFGRFSSGVTVIHTRRGSDVWRAAVNSPDLSFRTVRNKPWAFTGIESFGPRFGIGGPLVKGRLFLEASAQGLYQAAEVESRPQDQTRVTKWISAFGRIDANLTPRQTLVTTVNLYPSKIADATLNTFNGPDVAADVNDTLVAGSSSLRSTIAGATVLESTIQISRYRIGVAGHGAGPMELAPSGNTGSFFNRQSRSINAIQWVESATVAKTFRGVSHLFRVGVDVMRSDFDGTSQSQPIEIRRDDGTLVRRLTFSDPIVQSVVSSDVAAFAQDRMQPIPHLLMEFGGRVDRDGVTGEFNITPRIGTVIMLNESGTAIARGGFGWFFERTPSVVGAFDQFEAATDTRYQPDGQTPLGSSFVFRHVAAPDIETARSAMWNVSYEHHLAGALTVRVGMLERRGTHELVVNPVVNGATATLLLTSTGRARYRGAEFTVVYSPSRAFDLNASYTRSSAEANLNAYTSFFDSIRWPIVGTDSYAPVASHAPNRLLARTRAIFRDRWLISAIVEARSGFPYSAVNAALDWVGPRNQVYHFPAVAVLDLNVERRVRLGKFRPFIGLRAYNALNRFTPSEVQNNLASAAFGTFYNTRLRQYRLQVRFVN